MGLFKSTVMPAKAGTQSTTGASRKTAFWVPAFAGMTALLMQQSHKQRRRRCRVKHRCLR